MSNYDWDAHWKQLEEDAAGLEQEIIKLARILHSVFDGRAWATGELDCWCGTFDENDIETLHPDPSTNCWRLAAAIILESESRAKVKYIYWEYGTED